MTNAEAAANLREVLAIASAFPDARVTTETLQLAIAALEASLGDTDRYIRLLTKEEVDARKREGSTFKSVRVGGNPADEVDAGAAEGMGRGGCVSRPCCSCGKPCCTLEEHKDHEAVQLNCGHWTCSRECWDREADQAISALEALEERERELSDLRESNNHWMVKAECYGDMVHGITPILGNDNHERPVDAARRVVAERDALKARVAALEGPGREEVARFLAVWRWSNGKPDPGETREPSPLDYEGADAVLALRGRT